MYSNETMYCNFTIYLFHYGCSIGNGIFFHSYVNVYQSVNQR